MSIGCYQSKNKSFINDLQQDNIRGHAKRIITKIYFFNDLAAAQLTQIVVDDIDQKGVLIQDSICDVAEKRVTQKRYIYNNKILVEIQTLVNGKKSEYTGFETDRDGNLITVKDYDATGMLKYCYKNITLNRFGLLVSAFNYKADGTIIGYSENQYKGTQLIDGFTKDDQGVIVYCFHAILNRSQDPLEFREVNITKNSTKSNTFNYTYTKFDCQRNWTEQMCYKHKKEPFRLTQRFISYYR
jgi:hypothetical protein